MYKKVYTGSGWKSQFGGSDLQLIEINDVRPAPTMRVREEAMLLTLAHSLPALQRYKLWVDECAKAFGGMDLLAVDALKGTYAVRGFHPPHLSVTRVAH